MAYRTSILPSPLRSTSSMPLGAERQVGGPPQRLAMELAVALVEERLHAFALVAHQGQEIRTAVAVDVDHRNMDRAGARIQSLGLETGPLARRSDVPQQQDLARAVPPEFRDDQVELARAVGVDGPHVGHASQSGGQDDLLERSATRVLPQPHDLAAIVIQAPRLPKSATNRSMLPSRSRSQGSMWHGLFNWASRRTVPFRPAESSDPISPGGHVARQDDGGLSARSFAHRKPAIAGGSLALGSTSIRSVLNDARNGVWASSGSGKAIRSGARERK